MGSRQSYSETFDERPLPQTGDVLDQRYRLEKLLGVGGMGAVFAATDQATRGRVAIKVLLPEEAESVESTRRFEREARASQSIDSPHVARVFGIGRLDSGLPYMVLELLDGESVDKVIRRRAPLDVTEAVDCVLQACEGVAAAHSRGIIHRDLKPSNLHLSTGVDGRQVVKVLDFGIAKATSRLDPNTDGLSLTESSSTLGSPQYMSPEQLRCSKTVDARTDIWALGLILHKLLTARGAFEADNVGAQFAMIISDAPTPLRQHLPELPAELEAIVLCCLEKNLEHRYQDVAQLAEALLPFAPPEGHDRVRRTRAILQRAGVSAPSLPAPSHPELALVEAATVVDTARTRKWRREETEATSRTWNTPQSPTPPRRAGLWVAASVAVAAIALGGFGWYQLDGGQAAPAGSNSAEELRPSATSPTPPPAETARAPESIRIKLTIDPADATVWFDGARTPANPITLPRSDRVHEIVVRAPGFVAERREVKADGDATVEITLTEEQRTAAPALRPAAPPRKPSGTSPTPNNNGNSAVQPKGPWSDKL